MKKIFKTIFCAVSVSALFAINASATVRDSLIVNNRFIDNTFISTGAGVEANYTPGLGLGFNARSSFALDFSFGKWFTPAFGFRIGFQGLNFNDWEIGTVLLPGANAVMGKHDGKNMYNVRTEYDYFHGDFLWNISNTIGGYKKDRRVSFIPYAHLGYEWLYNSFTSPRNCIKRDYAAGLGLLANVRIYNNLSFYADLRTTSAVRHTRDTGSKKTLLGLSFYGLVGFTYDIRPTEWNKWNKVGNNNRKGYMLNRFKDNMFVGANAGMAYFSVLNSDFTLNARPEFMFSFNVGKWFTPAVGARIVFGRSKLSHYALYEENAHDYLVQVDDVFHGTPCRLYTFGFNRVHADLMWHPLRAFNGANRRYFWSPIPYLSMGAAFSTSQIRKIVFRNDFLAGIGLLNRFSITKDLSIDLDVKTFYMSARKYGNTNKTDSFVTDVAIGMTYDINNWSWREFNHAVVNRFKPVKKDPTEGPLMHGGFVNNAFITLFTGVNCIFSKSNSGVAPGMEFTFGKWFHPSFGLRLGVAGLGQNEGGTESGFVYPHADFMLNATNIAMWNNIGTRIFDISPYLGAGYLASFTSNNLAPKLIQSGAGFDAGLLTSFAIGKRAQANLDLRYTQAGGGRFFSGLLGLTYALGETKWLSSMTETSIGQTNRSENVKKVKGYFMNHKFFDNTFISYTGGVNTLDFKGVGSAINIAGGKFFTPAVGIRLGYQGRKAARNDGDVYTKINTDLWHVDVLWNPIETIAGYKKERVYTPSLYAEAGALLPRTPNGAYLGAEFIFGGGFLNSFKVSDRLSILLDLKALAFQDTYTRSNPDKKFSLYGSALAGVSYAFGKTDWEPGVAYEDGNDVQEERERPWAISTNLLGYADLLTANLEIQYALNRHWSLSMQGKSNNLIVKEGQESQIMDRKSSAAIGAKYWPWYVYCGLWTKMFVQTEGYSRSNLIPSMGFEKGNAYGAGAAVGYSLIINRWFNLDFGFGLWTGYKTVNEYKFPELDVCASRQGKAFIDISEISISAMFIF